jgi:hypothetical protein
MSAGMQQFNIGRMLSNTRWDTEMFDVHAHLDRSLHYDENAKNIRQHLGISTRNRGAEMFEQQNAERAREQKRRAVPNYQTGISNLIVDRRFQALRPGKRFSAGGHRYYERRADRSDRGHLL